MPLLPGLARRPCSSQRRLTAEKPCQGEFPSLVPSFCAVGGLSLLKPNVCVCVCVLSSVAMLAIATVARVLEYCGLS